MPYRRYAIYFTASGSKLARDGASWLGWDIATGAEVAQPDGLADATATPRKYGFHGTLKPPFFLADGTTFEELTQASRALAGRLAPFEVPAFRVNRLGSFLALTTQDTPELRALASTCVMDLDAFRAPPSEAELERRRASGLSARQEKLLEEWGYPYVHEEFRFHLTLSGRLPPEAQEEIAQKAEHHFDLDDKPHPVVAVTLCGERKDGRFEEIEVLPFG